MTESVTRLNSRILKTRSSSVLAVDYEWRNNARVTLHNFHEKPKNTTLQIGDSDASRLTSLLVGEHSHADANGKHKIVLEGYGYRWYRVGGLGHILRREKY